MLDLRLLQGSLLRKLIEAIEDLVGAGTFNFTATGVSLQAREWSSYALVAVFLPSEAFKHYRCDPDISLGFNLGNLSNVLKAAAAGEDDDHTVTIKAAEDDDFVHFGLERPNHQEITNFKLKLEGLDDDSVEIKEIEYDAIVRMPSVEFVRICRLLSTRDGVASIEQNVTISVANESVVFSNVGRYTFAVDINLRQNSSVDKPEEATTIIEMLNPVSHTCCLERFNSCTKGASLSNQVTISLKSDNPLLVEYRVAETGYVRFYLPVMEGR